MSGLAMGMTATCEPAIQTRCGLALRVTYPVNLKSLSRPRFSMENLAISVSNYGYAPRLMVVPGC